MALEAEQASGEALTLAAVSAPGLAGEHPLIEVSLGLEPGQALAVLGGYGSGAASLLRILGGILPPGAGQVSVPPGGAFFLPEAPEFGLGVTVAELAAALDLSPTAYSNALERLGLHRLAKRSVQGLPAPLRARVGLAALSASDRPVLVAEALEEGLDVECRGAGAELLAACAAAGKILVLGCAKGWVAPELEAHWLALRGGRVVAQAAPAPEREPHAAAWFEATAAEPEAS